MDSVHVSPTWISFAYHVWDSVAPYLIPAVTAALGWALPSPFKRGRK